MVLLSEKLHWKQSERKRVSPLYFLKIGKANYMFKVNSQKSL